MTGNREKVNRQKLEQLLQNGSSELDGLRSELPHSELEIVAVVDIPGKQAYDIYSTRSLINTRKGGGVSGYQELLPRLEQASGRTIRIFWLHLKLTSTRIFMDVTTSEVLGILTARSEGPKEYPEFALLLRKK